MKLEERKRTAIAIAKMYYVNGDSQDHIARVTGMSRSNISRILRKCVTDGVVESLFTIRSLKMFNWHIN